MTRHEAATLQDALFELHEGYLARAVNIIERVLRTAAAEHAAEDAHHNHAEADAYPINTHLQAAE